MAATRSKTTECRTLEAESGENRDDGGSGGLDPSACRDHPPIPERPLNRLSSAVPAGGRQRRSPSSTPV
jgi:hypothetical protein